MCKLQRRRNEIMEMVLRFQMIFAIKGVDLYE